MVVPLLLLHLSLADVGVVLLVPEYADLIRGGYRKGALWLDDPQRQAAA